MALETTARLRVLLSRLSSPGGRTLADISEALDLLHKWRPLEGKADTELVVQWVGWLDAFLQRTDCSDEVRRRAIQRLHALCAIVEDLPPSYELQGTLVDDQTTHETTALSDVYRANLNGTVVAAKYLRVYSDDLGQLRKGLRKEAFTSRSLQHRNIVQFRGFRYTPSHRLCLVSKWMVNGTLGAFLERNPNENKKEYISDIIDGLTYIHDLDLVHGDLRPTNVLVDENRRACLADTGFGTSCVHSIVRHSSRPTPGTVEYHAPELLSWDAGDDTAGRPTRKSDVYSLGCVMYQILGGSAPHYEWWTGRGRTELGLVLKLREGLKPSKSTRYPIPQSDWRVLEDCWQLNPAMRPILDQVAERMAN